jgi:hypothetical protein
MANGGASEPQAIGYRDCAVTQPWDHAAKRVPEVKLLLGSKAWAITEV